MLKKQYNTPDYRSAKRLVAFVEPSVKASITKQAKKEGVSISSFISKVLAEWVNG